MKSLCSSEQSSCVGSLLRPLCYSFLTSAKPWQPGSGFSMPILPGSCDVTLLALALSPRISCPSLCLCRAVLGAPTRLPSCTYTLLHSYAPCWTAWRMAGSTTAPPGQLRSPAFDEAAYFQPVAFFFFPKDTMKSEQKNMEATIFGIFASPPPQALV